MGIRRLCLYQVDATDLARLPGFRVTRAARNRDELRNMLGVEAFDALIVDLDAADAFDAIVEALEIKPDLAVVGIIGSNNVDQVIAAQRAGCKQLTSKPLNLNDLTVAIRRALQESGDHDTSGLTVAVMGATGGAGATTIACYLTSALAEVTQTDAAIIDMDFDFGGVAQAWDAAGKYTIADIAAAGAVDTLMIENAAMKIGSGVHVIARPPTIEQGHEIDELIMGQILQTTRKVYHRLVLDLPRKLDAVTGAAIKASDKLLIVLQLTVPAIENARRLVNVLLRYGIPMEQIEFVINRYRKSVHNLSIEMVEEQFKKPILGTVPNNYKSVSAAFDIGRPISQRDPVRCAIADLAQTLVQSPGPGAAAPTPAKTGGWFSGLRFGRRPTVGK